MRVYASALAFVLTLINGLDADVKHLELALVNHARLPNDVLVTLRSEVEEIWNRELSIEWSTEAASVRPSGADYLYVELCRRNAPKPPHRAIATIVFNGPHPSTHIHVHPSEALALLDRKSVV